VHSFTYGGYFLCLTLCFVTNTLSSLQAASISARFWSVVVRDFPAFSAGLSRTSFRIVPSSTPNNFAAGSKVANSTYSGGIFS
jgi:hypothetical protein